MGDEKVENTEDSKKIGSTGDLATLDRAAVAINTGKDRKGPKGTKKYQKDTENGRKDTEKNREDTEKDHNDTETDACTYLGLIPERRLNRFVPE